MVDEERWALIEEACGIVGAQGRPDAARLVMLGLHALQHRGQESSGIVTRDAGGALHAMRHLGLVAASYTPAHLDALPGAAAIGHVRYSTTGEPTLENAQPVCVATRFGALAIAHNGHLTNADALREALEARGARFETQTDTEVIGQLVAWSEAETLEAALIEALGAVEGAFSVVGLCAEALIAARDARGVRPLVLGRLDGAPLIASETCCLDLLGARYEREIALGELLIIAPGGAERSLRPLPKRRAAPCIFELVYFARPDSTVFGRSVYAARRRMGELLAAHAPAEADVVVAVPDSALPAAVGFAAASGLPLEPGLIPARHIGRTFIEPTQERRELGVRLKLAALPAVVRGRRVVVIDDSIVRGTTSQQIIRMLREAGAAEVHMRVASPPTLNPCSYGIDTRSQGELIAAGRELEAVRDLLGADSLAYLSIEGLREAASGEGPELGFCERCFEGG